MAEKRTPRLKNVWRKPRSVVTLDRLTNKRVTYTVPVLRRNAWRRLLTTDPAIPRSYSQLRATSRVLFDRKRREAVRKIDWEYLPAAGLLVPAVEECGEAAYAAYFAGLSNPYLTKRQRDELEGDLDEDTPTFEHEHETDHFILRWTDTSSHAADNITDASIVTDTAGFLEHAWGVYVAEFGVAPYVPAGASKIEVVFQDISGLGVASPPDGPIKFDAASWTAEPGIRRPTSAHELFHKLQYAFGYRTTWSPVSPYKWFSEGTASWAEVFVWQRVSRSYKIQDLFSNPDLNLYDASYRALPFWVFFEARQRSDPADNPMVNFMTKYQGHGNEELALEQAIEDEWAPNNVYRTLPNFFALFSRERTRGAWKTGPTGAVYTDLLGPDDAILAPPLTTVDVPLGSGDTYVNTGVVSEIGSDYYAFRFGADTDGDTLSVTVDGAVGGDFSHYQVWQHDGGFRRGVFPPGSTGDYSFSETIQLAEANELVLIVSGRGTGGTYTVTATVV